MIDEKTAVSSKDFSSILKPLDGAARRAGDSIKWGRYAEGVLPLWLADMDYLASPAIVEVLQARVATGDFGYRSDSPHLRALMVERLLSRYDWAIDAGDVMFSPGLVFAMNAFTRAFGKPGDGVLILTPVYPPFFSAIANAGLKAQEVPLVCTEQDGILHYDIDFDALEAAVTPETHLMMLCNPHNPVGRAYTRDELRQLSEFALRHDLVVCSDEIHADLLSHGVSHLPMPAVVPEIADHLVTLMAPSKTFNLPGMGLGMVIVQNAALRARMQNAIYSLGGFPSSLSYTAAEAAYSQAQPWLDAILAHLEDNRDALIAFMREHLPQIPLTQPEGTYLAWLDCRALSLPEGVSPSQFFERTAQVGLNDGVTFGTPGIGFVRLNYACPRETLMKGLNQMLAAVETLG